MSQHKEFWETMRALYDVGVLDDLMLIGSWAEVVYQESGVLRGYQSGIHTLDMDILIPNVKRVRSRVNLPEILESIGFELDVWIGQTG